MSVTKLPLNANYLPIFREGLKLTQETLKVRFEHTSGVVNWSNRISYAFKVPVLDREDYTNSFKLFYSKESELTDSEKLILEDYLNLSWVVYLYPAHGSRRDPWDANGFVKSYTLKVPAKEEFAELEKVVNFFKDFYPFYEPRKYNTSFYERIAFEEYLGNNLTPERLEKDYGVDKALLSYLDSSGHSEITLLSNAAYRNFIEKSNNKTLELTKEVFKKALESFHEDDENIPFGDSLKIDLSKNSTRGLALILSVIDHDKSSSFKPLFTSLRVPRSRDILVEALKTYPIKDYMAVYRACTHEYYYWHTTENPKDSIAISRLTVAMLENKTSEEVKELPYVKNKSYYSTERDLSDKKLEEIVERIKPTLKLADLRSWERVEYHLSQIDERFYDYYLESDEKTRIANRWPSNLGAGVISIALDAILDSDEERTDRIIKLFMKIITESESDSPLNSAKEVIGFFLDVDSFIDSALPISWIEEFLKS